MRKIDDMGEGWTDIGRVKVALLNSSVSTGFDNTTGWKKNEDGSLAVDDAGNPVFVGNDGKEMVVKGNTIPQMMGENRQYRERAQTAETQLKAFEGLDPETARQAVEKLKGVDLDKMVESGKLDEVRAQLTQQYSGKLTDAEKRAQELQQRIDEMAVDHAFSSSDFVRERIAVPPEMFKAQFGKHFKREDDKIVPYDANGQVIYSAKNMAQVATMDEAFEILLDGYKYKDTILKPIGHEGSGNSGQGGNRSQSGRRMTRADIEAMPAHKQAEVWGQVGKGEITVI